MAGTFVGMGIEGVLKYGFKNQTWTNPFSAIGKGWIARIKTVTPFFTPVILATIWGFVLKEQEKTNPDKPIFKFLDKYFAWAH